MRVIECDIDLMQQHPDEAEMIPEAIKRIAQTVARTLRQHPENNSVEYLVRFVGGT